MTTPTTLDTPASPPPTTKASRIIASAPPAPPARTAAAPKKPKPAAKAKKPTTKAGITDRNPFFPYVDLILSNCVLPQIEHIMQFAAQEGEPIRSRDQLLRAYRKASSSRVSMTTFKQWLDLLDFRTQTTFGRNTNTSASPSTPPVAPAASRPRPAPEAPTPEGDGDESPGEFADLLR